MVCIGGGGVIRCLFDVILERLVPCADALIKDARAKVGVNSLRALVSRGFGLTAYRFHTDWSEVHFRITKCRLNQ